MHTVQYYHSYIIKGTTNLRTDASGWRIVGLWGDEDKGEGHRIGPSFPEDCLDDCEKLVDQLESLYGLPVKCTTIFSHFSGFYEGDRVNTKDGVGTIEEIRLEDYPYLVRLDSGMMAWQDSTHILSKDIPPNSQA